MRALAPLLLALTGPSCRKVPLYDVAAYFTLADATWFAEEETLFVFYEVQAEQGLGEPSVIEVTYATDTERVDWTPVTLLPEVHRHEPVDCGTNAMCGSASVHVPLQPREIGIRLRYHRAGELALDAPTVYNVVEAGPAHRSRSLIVYGVLDETNRYVQWRARHSFPTLRNEQVEDLGLRRHFEVRDPRFGDVSPPPSNPYGYGTTCDLDLVPAGLAAVETDERAVFHPDPLPLGASDAAAVCAEATVTDALGEFTTTAIARKNPEVRPAFPVLRSPVRDATPLPFFLGPCDRTISPEHEEMQRQRLLLGDLETTCTDDWDQPGFVDSLVVKLRDAVEAARPAGDDMVLVLAVNQDDEGVSEAVEEALAQVVPAERERNSPRLAGAFVFDSSIRGLQLDELAPVTLWCPSTLPTGQLPDASSRTCAVAPDDITFDLGPLSFGALPILPSRDQYLDFLEDFSDSQAGWVETLSFRTPEFAATAEHVGFEQYGVVTFLNGERISADADDAFSFCVGNEPQLVVFRSRLATQGVDRGLCEDLGFDDEVCDAIEFGGAPLYALPDWHDVFRERGYDLGVFWEFPFLLRMEYRLVAAGSLSAFGFSVPFGVSEPAQAYYGTEFWLAEQLSLEQQLTQCDRFCDHPTFDGAGVYHVTDPFRSTYANTCYLPRYPELSDSGFPLDP